MNPNDCVRFIYGQGCYGCQQASVGWPTSACTEFPLYSHSVTFTKVKESEHTCETCHYETHPGGCCGVCVHDPACVDNWAPKEDTR